MQKISGTKIILTRGDTFKAKVMPTKPDGEPFRPAEGDSIRFALKKSYSDPEVLIEKIVPIDTLLLHIEPADTKNLAFGTYVYDIQLTYANGDIDTFIDRAQFELTEEVD